DRILSKRAAALSFAGGWQGDVRARWPARHRMMNPAEFANIARCERDLWWYRGMREILFRMADPYLRGRKIRHALEAGCGTGYLSHLLQTGRGLPVTPLDLSFDGLCYARDMGVERLVQGNIMRLP